MDHDVLSIKFAYFITDLVTRIHIDNNQLIKNTNNGRLWNILQSVISLLH